MDESRCAAVADPRDVKVASIEACTDGWRTLSVGSGTAGLLRNQAQA